MEKVSLLFLQAVVFGLEGRKLEDPGLTPDEWRRLMQLSAEQSLLPLVFEAVYSILPEEMEKEYRAVSLNWICEQVRKTHLFLEMYCELVQRGIEPLVIKGIVCRDSYSLPDWRPSSDEDIYIERGSYENFHTNMMQLGFKGQDPNFRSEHEVLYRRGELKVEGHWELFPMENRIWEQMNRMTVGIIDRARYLEIDKVRIRTPEPTDHIIYLLLHAMKHFSLAGVGIRQICDIVQWDRKYSIDWDRVYRTIEPLGGIGFTAAILDAGHRYFKMGIPEGWTLTDSTALIEDALEGGSFGHNTEERTHSASMTAADGTGHTTAYNLFRTVFPTREVMEINYPWISRSGLLLPLGWGVRLVQYAKKIGRGQSPVRTVRIGKQRLKLMRQYGIFQESTGRDPEED